MDQLNLFKAKYSTYGNLPPTLKLHIVPMKHNKYGIEQVQ